MCIFVTIVNWIIFFTKVRLNIWRLTYCPLEDVALILCVTFKYVVVITFLNISSTMFCLYVNGTGSCCRNQCWPRSMLPYGVIWLPYGVTRQQWVKKSLYFKLWLKKTITMTTKLRLCGWSPGLKWTDAIPPVVFRYCIFGFLLITSRLFISWKWKHNHGYWSLNVFLYVLMIECFEWMILCVGIYKIFSCILFLEGTLTISRNFVMLKIGISQILTMKFLEILEANLKMI